MLAFGEVVAFLEELLSWFVLCHSDQEIEAGVEDCVVCLSPEDVVDHNVYEASPTGHVYSLGGLVAKV